jgi:superfamily II DNA or RNA helicase
MIVGVSGTCYVGDEYFADVIHRYSLRQAIEERFVKRVEYVAEMPETDNPEEKWQLIYSRHQDWKKKLKRRGIRPLTIVVTRGIADCKRVSEELQGFLEEWEKIRATDAVAKVLPVTSAKEHQPNVARLRTVDNPASKVEWIVSVSMLSEGWDVKNVFQIVPREERAFNSKLLIAQVLGRGLRRPDCRPGLGNRGSSVPTTQTAVSPLLSSSAGDNLFERDSELIWVERPALADFLAGCCQLPPRFPNLSSRTLALIKHHSCDIIPIGSLIFPQGRLR